MKYFYHPLEEFILKRIDKIKLKLVLSELIVGNPQLIKASYRCREVQSVINHRFPMIWNEIEIKF